MNKKKLLIVESPNKAESIRSYLDLNQWDITFTKGHFKDLPQDKLSVKEVDGEYQANFIITNKMVFETLKNKIAAASHIYIATDDDNEGEAIAYDIVTTFKLNRQNYTRVIFREITKKSISDILTNLPKEYIREIDIKKVEARYGRRLVDRIVGYKISSLLKNIFKQREDIKIKGIGRVSYPTLAILTTREEEIENFEIYNYRKIYVVYNIDGYEFVGFLKKKFIEWEEDEEFFETIHRLKTYDHIVEDIEVIHKDVQPPKPLTISQLYSDVYFLYQIGAKETLKILQKLFEGVNINGEKTGLISYPRTDSVRINEDTEQTILRMIPKIVIKKEDGPIGSSYAVDIPRKYKQKENVQDAHEAIRPTLLTKEYRPENLRSILTENEFLIYRFIYYRTISAYMSDSQYIEKIITINCDELEIEGRTLERMFDGWECIGKYYVPSFAKTYKTTQPVEKINIGDELISYSVHETLRAAKRPDRYSEGGLIKTLESKGIGRPSTYAQIISNITEKEYVKQSKGVLIPNTVAREITKWAKENANWIIDYNNTREFLEELDQIEQGKLNKESVIRKYSELIKKLYDQYGFVDYEDYKSAPPSEKQIEFLDRIKSYGIVIQEEAYQRRETAIKVINQYLKDITISKCRFCKKGKIQVHETYYKCDNKACDFFITKDRIESFIKKFQIDEENQEKLHKEIFKKKFVYIQKLQGKNTIFNADIYIEKNEKYGYIVSFTIK